MNEENFAMQLVEKQLKRDEYKFYTVCALFLVFMLFAFLWPVASNVTQAVDNSENVTQEVNNESNSKG